MEGLTLGEIAKALALFGAIATPIALVLRCILKPFLNMEKRVKALEDSDKVQEWRIQDSMEQRALLINGMHAVLEGLIEQGCNGPVKTAKKEIENYLKGRPFK